MHYAYCLKLIGVFVFGEFDFSLLKYALDPVQIVFLHFDQGLRDEPVVNACLVEFLELLSLVQVRKGSLKRLLTKTYIVLLSDDVAIGTIDMN